ncbi:putative inactive purple acid phosphatase 27 [Dichanthelium oligosanthes]|uniref:Purple acid phosphatase n=1 Tax=Dichanthelium oligosanthes TaxID=888268 RepID=A0A1E5UI58_9POAL|nr:putative inactive purple acid phosphatase 27 [Dichanthelium oligosanthes]
MGARVLPSSLHMAAVVVVAALTMVATAAAAVAVEDSTTDNIQPLSTLKMQAAQVAMDSGAVIHASPDVLGKNGEDSAWVTVNFTAPAPSAGHWVALFSPADFGLSVGGGARTNAAAGEEGPEAGLPTAPIKYMFANISPSFMSSGSGDMSSSSGNLSSGSGNMSFLVINQRSDYAFGLFSGGKDNPKLIAVSNKISFANPKAPVFPRLSQGKEWNEMAVTWTSGYNINEAYPFVEWKMKGGESSKRTPAGTLTYTRSHLCGASDGTNELAGFQPGAQGTTDRLIKDLPNYDAVFHIGDLSYANGFLAQWDQFTAQIEPIASKVPYMVASGNHERTYHDTGVFYNGNDSRGECGVPAETYFYAPAENRGKFRYAADYGMFRFCVGDTEHDWRPASEQHAFLDRCFASADRKHQPWLVFAAHRPLGYSSNDYYATEGSFSEPMGRTLQGLWQKHRVDLAIYGHVHNYERTCPVYENTCMDGNKDKGSYSGTIHVVAGTGGAKLRDYSAGPWPQWSVVRDKSFG